MTMRAVSYAWRLREVMAAHGMFATTDLVPLLRERSIELSVSQVHRLVTGVPERLSLPVLAALCDIFECSPAELVHTSAQNLGVRRVAGGPDGAPLAPAPAGLRPAAARILPDQ